MITSFHTHSFPFLEEETHIFPIVAGIMSGSVNSDPTPLLPSLPSSSFGSLSLSSECCLNDTFNKPDFRELDLGSPVSTLRTRPTPASSSSSSGSLSGRPGSTAVTSSTVVKSHSGELSGEISPTGSKPDSGSGYAHPSVNSPPLNVLPTGNICPSGKILKTGMTRHRRSGSRTDVLGTGSVNYGHGSIMRTTTKSHGANTDKSRGSANGSSNGTMDPEEVKRVGNEHYKAGRFMDALSCYDKAISVSPGNAAYRSNRAAALTQLGRLGEAVMECEEAVRLDPSYLRAHHRLGSLFIRLGQVDNARHHICLPRQQPDPTELLKLQSVEKHLGKCVNTRKVGDWKNTLREVDAAIAAGADSSPQLFACKTEALLKLHQLDDAESSLSNIPKLEAGAHSSSQTKFFGMLSETYLLFVRAQIEMSLGRFENAVTAVEKAAKIDPKSVEVAVFLNNVKLVSRARTRGNDLFKSERYTEACSAYGEGLRIDPANSVLYCNRAACWFKIGMWDESIEDCNQALRFQPNYTKALLRRAASNRKLERWVDAVRDYEALKRALPDDNEVAESLFHTKVALRKSRGEDVHNMKFGGEVEVVSDVEQFKEAICSPGVSVVHFQAACNEESMEISPFFDKICSRYPSINFLKVDIGESPSVANLENVRIVPTFKIYKDGSRVKEMICPTRQVLEYSVRHYRF